MEGKHTSHLDMLNGPIAVKLIWFALPVAGAALLQQLLNSADVAVVGRFSSNLALAAVGANAFVINLMINLFVGLSVGANVVIARLIGEQDAEGVSHAVHTSVAISLISGVLLTFIGWFGAETILSWLSTPREIMDLAVLYLRIYFLGMPFIMLMNFCAAILRSKGDTKRPLLVMVVSGIVNVLLNLFFVLRCGMSVEGVAIATLISSVISSVWLLVLLMREHGMIQVRLREVKVYRDSLVKIAVIGVPAGIQGMLFNFSNVVIQGGINTLGANAIAANTASLNYDYFCYFIANAFAQAGTSFLSQNYGAKNYHRCKKVIRDTILLGFILTFIPSIIITLLAEPACMVFTSDAEVIRLAVERTIVVMCIYSVHSFNETLSGLLRALGYSFTPTLICIVFICGVRLLWIYFVFPSNPSLGFLSCCYPISWVVNATILAISFFFIQRRLLNVNPFSLKVE